MKEKTKKILGVTAIVGAVFVLTSCNSFCNTEDISNVRYRIDPINTKYIPKEYLEDSSLPQLIYKDQNGFETNLKDLRDNSGNLILAPLPNNENLYYIRSTIYTVKELKKDGKSYNTSIQYFGLNSTVYKSIASASSSGIATPSFTYWEKQDEKLLDLMVKESNLDVSTLTYNDIYGYPYELYSRYFELYTKSQNTSLENSEKDEKEILANVLLAGSTRNAATKTEYYDEFSNYLSTFAPEYIKKNKDNYITSEGKIKFKGKLNSNLEKVSSQKHSTDGINNNDYFNQIIVWDNEIREEIGDVNCLNKDFLSIYKNNLNSAVNNFKSCISTTSDYYGHFGEDELTDTVLITNKTGTNYFDGWGKAFKVGFFEGLLVYPIGTMVETFSHLFGMNGWGQIWSVLLVTLIVRLIFMLVTLPSTLSQQKMQFLQPEMARLQQKYPNSQTNQYDKQNLAKEQMALYKKYKVHPFLSIVVMFIQFPVFICVWNALQGSASLASDAVLGLRLSDSIWSVLKNVVGWPSNVGWWTALVLIILMSAAQICAMLLPNWLNKKRMKNVTKLTANPSADKQNKQMKIVQYVMTGFIIIMGFTLPAAMGVYWLAGALFSMLQSVIIYFIFQRKGLKSN